jgi:predicted ATP-grasp superfamily ATP-dependent carboligase
MRAEPSRLIIVASSGRAMAESAVRGGYSVAVVDGFCDQDTLAVASCAAVRSHFLGIDPDGVRTEVERLAARAWSGGLVYGAGLERASATLGWLAGRVPVFGNGPDVIECLRDPPRFFGLLDDLRIPHPEIRFEPPLHDKSEWLVKEPGTSGGLGVHRWRSTDEPLTGEHYFQRFLDGTVSSVLFIADGADYSIIGFNRLMVAAIGDRPFLYGGAVSQAVLAPDHQRSAEHAVRQLVSALGLRGVNNLDFVSCDGRLYLLELNPRPSATLSLYDADCAGGWIRRHVRACLGELPARSSESTRAIRGHRVVYAPRGLEIAPRVPWPTWAKDRPVPGTRLAAGAPLCTVLAAGDAEEIVERRLLDRQRTILAMILDASADGGSRVIHS